MTTFKLLENLGVLSYHIRSSRLEGKMESFYNNENNCLYPFNYSFTSPSLSKYLLLIFCEPGIKVQKVSKADGTLRNLGPVVLSIMTFWRQQCITIGVSKKCLNKKFIYLHTLVFGYSHHDVLYCLSICVWSDLWNIWCLHKLMGLPS